MVLLFASERRLKMQRFWEKDNEAVLLDTLFAGHTCLEMFMDSWEHGRGVWGGQRW